ncbi:MAG: RIP metalloprotease RseP [Schwartzia sp.]|nr:RIP metalloprotease RseP [Schwartzia sp. (in: firmicutes)]MBO6235576.1 RIP metalloprotease RseP [Schwartzia sp. (in: firmicutes)]MBO6294209.1 RIP metalloprotease RseP [Schwartzia sp. (in: firmicutes)]
MVLTIVASVFVFGLLVLFHEFGHFIMAKATGMRVDEFAIGFGPKIVSKKIGETEYSIRCVPLGGFNDIAGMDPAENDAGDRGYCEKPVWKRMIVIVAGPLMNFLLPIVIFFFIFMIVGLSSPSTRPELGEVMPDQPAAMAGLQSGDRIDSINEEPVNEWDDIVRIVHGADGSPMKIAYHRGDEARQATVIPVFDKQNNRMIIGIMGALDTWQPSVIEAAEAALFKTGYVIYHMIEGLVQIFTGEAAAELAGPLGVMQMTGTVAKLGFTALMNFAALLSLNLGIINLLPVPALDGGHFVTLLLEALRGKPLGEKAMHYTQIAGITVLVALMLFATKNDIVRIFFGG